MVPMQAQTHKDFTYLDSDDFTSVYFSPEKTDELRFYISGIRCGKCVRKLEDLPQTVNGLKQLRVEMGNNVAYAQIDKSQTSFSQIAEKICELGFSPMALPTSQDEEKIVKQEDRSELVRLGIAAACAGNIMTFSFATYLGDTGALKEVFYWLSFMLYLPVVTYVAWPFYKGAYNSVKQKQLSIDLPMAVASFLGFVFSTVELLLGRDEIYFDSLSGFLFLILLSRWTQKRLQRRFLKPEEISEGLNLQRARLLNTEGAWVWAPVANLKSGDCILLEANEIAPADGALETKQAHFGMAWLSGELKPKHFFQNAVIPAGARLASGEAVLKISKLLPETGFGELLEKVQKFSLSKNRVVSLADKWAQWLLATVFALAVIFLIAYWNISSEDAIKRSLALIILACPCAMAFGTPLAMASALRRSKSKGLVVRTANIFESVTKVKTIVFDKTGTLTDTELSLIEPAKFIPLEIKQIVLTLENVSVHPIAFAFRKAFSDASPLPVATAVSERPGRGVSGYINGKYYELKKSITHNSVTGCELFENGRSIFDFTFDAAIKPEAAETILKLRSQGYNLLLVSGDNAASVERLGFSLGFKRTEIFSEMSPEQKGQLIRDINNSMMVGDGINDSVALMNATVGVAASGGMESALRSSDVFLADSGLKGVADLLEISKDSFALIKQNLTISLLYNCAGAALALAGYINPFVAALLMPVSSGFILLSTYLRGKK
jgi:Cu2+-exporting ATPase/Cu+-exporting ATPase